MRDWTSFEAFMRSTSDVEQAVASAKVAGAVASKAVDLGVKASVAIGKARARNAGLLGASIVANAHPEFHEVLEAFRARQTQGVLDHPDPREQA